MTGRDFRTKGKFRIYPSCRLQFYIFVPYFRIYWIVDRRHTSENSRANMCKTNNDENKPKVIIGTLDERVC